MATKVLVALQRARRGLAYVWRHPLTHGERLAAVARYCSFHLRQAARPRTETMAFVDGTSLYVGLGQAGVVANLYTHLADVEEMMLLLHLLRPDDLFVDVGANAGVYSVLASGAVGARTLAVEPSRATLELLRANIDLNNIGDKCHVIEAALSHEPGALRVTADAGAMNRVTDRPQRSTEVRSTTLDEICRDAIPTLVKIDVEGYESFVIAGGRRTLADERVMAIIVEMNGSGRSYGFTDAQVDEQLRSLGFQPVMYEPARRDLSPRASWNTDGFNTIYVRDLETASGRTVDAPLHRISPRHLL